MITHQFSKASIYISVWGVVDCINTCDALAFNFPSLQDQEIIRQGYKQKSGIGLSNIIGAIDGMLIWIKKPSLTVVDKLRCGQINFYCSRKAKYGLNLQAICDHNLEFRWIDIRYPGCASDYIAWNTSQLCVDLDYHCDRMVLSGCKLVGDSAYVKKKVYGCSY